MISSDLRRLPSAALALVLLVLTASCGADEAAGDDERPILRISSIPDQDHDKLAERDGAMAAYLSEELGVEVEYVPVTDYAASVSLFRSGDLDMVFFGGLTGVQARLHTPGSVLIAQRDIDASFRSVFIASVDSGIEAMQAVEQLSAFEGRRFTFGSETSTSGRLMPAFFLDQAGVSADDFSGPVGYSGSHDKTIELVESGTYEGGALNEQVWESRLADGSVDLTKVRPVLTTPAYHDYHWLAGPETDERFGDGFTDRMQATLIALDPGDPEQTTLLRLYGAQGFVPTSADNYRQIEDIGRKLGLVG